MMPVMTQCCWPFGGGSRCFLPFVKKVTNTLMWTPLPRWLKMKYNLKYYLLHTYLYKTKSVYLSIYLWNGTCLEMTHALRFSIFLSLIQQAWCDIAKTWSWWRHPSVEHEFCFCHVPPWVISKGLNITRSHSRTCLSLKHKRLQLH